MELSTSEWIITYTGYRTFPVERQGDSFEILSASQGAFKEDYFFTSTVVTLFITFGTLCGQKVGQQDAVSEMIGGFHSKYISTKCAT